MSKPEITITKSTIDGTVLVFIDTPDMVEDSEGPLLRVWLNDAVIYENPSVPVIQLTDDEEVAIEAANHLDDQTV